jgi:hypothetical protein
MISGFHFTQEMNLAKFSSKNNKISWIYAEKLKKLETSQFFFCQKSYLFIY